MWFNCVLFLFLGTLQIAWCQRGNCSRDRMRQCQEGLTRNIQRRVNDMNRSEMTAQCVNVRDDFNCLLRETRCLTSENERNRNGETLRSALKYVREGCDSQGASWRDSNCFIGDFMKQCENTNPLGGIQYSSYNPESCRKFNLFQECVMDVVRSRCRPDDERLLGQYLVDSASDLAWNCGESTSSVSDWDRTRDDRYDRYDRNGDRDRDRDWRAGGRDDYGRGRDRDSDRYSDRNDRNRGSDRNGGGYDRNGGYDRDRTGYGGSGRSDVTCCQSERCDKSRLQQCRDSLSRTIDIRLSGYQDSQKCRKIRDDFNCLLWQTSNCQERNERDRDNDIFRRARDYISRNCDSYGRWSENSCYKTPEMQRCETSLSSSRSGTNFESCRSYSTFYDCMQNELRRRCTSEDELFQGAYLVDKAQEMSWQCSGGSAGGRGSYDTRYDSNRDRDRDPYDYNNNREYNSPHLEDEDEMCRSRVEVYIEECKTNVNDKRRELYSENDFEIRRKITCCSARQYRSCLSDSVRRVCQTDRNRVVEALMGRFGYDLNSDSCRRIYDSDCDSAVSHGISFLLLFLCLVLLPRFFAMH